MNGFTIKQRILLKEIFEFYKVSYKELYIGSSCCFCKRIDGKGLDIYKKYISHSVFYEVDYYNDGISDYNNRIQYNSFSELIEGLVDCLYKLDEKEVNWNDE